MLFKIFEIRLSNLLLLSFFTFLNCNLFAQSPEENFEPCGTKMSTESINWLKNFQADPFVVKNGASLFAPIQFHIVGTNTGGGYFPEEEAYRIFCDLNQAYVPVGIQFYLNGPFNYINNSTFYSHDTEDGGIMMGENNYPDVINIYFVQDPNGACGYYSPAGDAIAIAKGCAGDNSTTVPHEVGHFLSLPHTFFGWESGDAPADPLQEKADGSNCASTADFFCDTPADYLYFRWFCPYTGGFSDPDGEAINPDQTLYMSYSQDYCQSRFSEEQMVAMRANLSTVRSDMSEAIHPSVDIGQTSILHPVNGNQQVNNSDCIFSWSSAVNATQYHLVISHSGQQDVNTYLTDTFFVADLLNNQNYSVTVRPMSFGNPCGGNTFANFKTQNQDFGFESFNVNSTNCNGEENGSLSIQMEGGNDDFEFIWTNGATTSSLGNLLAGNYTVTVSNSAGDESNYTFQVPEPENFNVNIEQTDNLSASVSIEGGTLPYSILWSSGESDDNASLLEPGTNSITIADSNGCLFQTDFNILGVEATINSISCNNNTDGSIEISPAGGFEPYSFLWSNGSTSNSITDLEEGTYTLLLQDATNLQVTLDYEIINPDPIQGLASVNGNMVVAVIVGGVEPYTYYWPTGVSDSQIGTDIPSGNYDMFVVDAAGCETTISFEIVGTSINDGINLAQTKIIKNPISFSENLSLEISEELKNNVALEIHDLNGRVIYSQNQILSNSEINWPNIKSTSGLYFVKLTEQKSGNKISFKIIVK